MNWPTVPARFVLTELDERGLRDGEDGELLSVSEYHGVVPRSGSASQQAASEDTSQYKRCQPGQLVLNRLWAFRGGLGVSPLTGLVSPDYAVFRIDSGMDARFVHYQTRSAWFVSEMTKRLRGIGSPDASNGRAPRINTRDLGRIEMYTPGLAVQRRVADMLDRVTGRIDILIAKNKDVLGTLRRRFVIMRRNVMAGVAPLGSLDAKAWVQAQGWRLAPLWTVCINHDNRRVPLNAAERAAQSGPYPYWGANAIQGYVRDWLYEGAHVLIGEDGAPYFNDKRDVAWVASGRYWVNNHAHVLEAVDTSPEWLAASLNLVDYSLYISGSTRDKLTLEDLYQIPVPVAPPAEERKILAELSVVQERTDRLAARIRDQIDLLEVRRQSLITAAVTGQLNA